MSLEHVVPNGSPPEIDVEVCVAALHTHETIPIAEKGENNSEESHCRQEDSWDMQL